MTATNPWDNWRPEIEGWSSDILPFYESLVAELPDGARCVEVGVYKGRSLIYLAEAFARHGKTAEIWGVDAWEASWCPDMWETFKGHVAATASPAREVIHVQRGPSNVALCRARSISSSSTRTTTMNRSRPTSRRGVAR